MLSYEMPNLGLEEVVGRPGNAIAVLQSAYNDSRVNVHLVSKTADVNLRVGVLSLGDKRIKVAARN